MVLRCPGAASAPLAAAAPGPPVPPPLLLVALRLRLGLRPRRQPRVVRRGRDRVGSRDVPGHLAHGLLRRLREHPLHAAVLVPLRRAPCQAIPLRQGGADTRDLGDPRERGRLREGRRARRPGCRPARGAAPPTTTDSLPVVVEPFALMRSDCEPPTRGALRRRRSTVIAFATDTSSLPPMLHDWLPVTESASKPTVCVSMLFATVVVLPLPAAKTMCWRPAASSMCIAFCRFPPGELTVASAVIVLFAGSAKGGGCFALYARPSTTGPIGIAHPRRRRSPPIPRGAGASSPAGSAASRERAGCSCRRRLARGPRGSAASRAPRRRCGSPPPPRR